MCQQNDTTIKQVSMNKEKLKEMLKVAHWAVVTENKTVSGILHIKHLDYLLRLQKSTSAYKIWMINQRK